MINTEAKANLLVEYVVKVHIRLGSPLTGKNGYDNIANVLIPLRREIIRL